MTWSAPPARPCPPVVNPSWRNSSVKGRPGPPARGPAPAARHRSRPSPGRPRARCPRRRSRTCPWWPRSSPRAHHPGRVQGRVEVRQVGLEHAVCPAELARQQRVQPLMAGLQVAGRERGDRRPAAQEYPDRGRAGQPVTGPDGASPWSRWRPTTGASAASPLGAALEGVRAIGIRIGGRCPLPRVILAARREV
jgi:hypothetical protein